MKKNTLLLIFALTLTKYGFAQAPQGFPYQAVARDNSGNLIANHNIALRFSILDGSNVGTTVYQETQTATTNLLGLFNLNIGQGTVISGTFNTINWASGAKLIKVELDTSGGSTFTLMGITQLMSVPYALHAGNSINSINSIGPVIDPGHPTTDSWTQKANVGNNVRSMGVGFSIGQLGYIGTGAWMNGFSALDDFWEYNAGNNTWTQKANFPGGGRKGAIGFSIGSKGYVGTGETGNAPTSYVNYDLWEYDPTLNSWTQKTNLTGSARKFATGFSIGNKGYIGLGTDGGSDLNDFWEYDPATDTWAQKANYSGNGRQFVSSFATSTMGYIGLGTDVNGNHYNDMNEYNPATNSWSGKSIIPAAGRHSTASFAMNNKGYIGTGFNSVLHLNEFWEYNPANDTWTSKATYSGSGRKNAVGFSIGNKGYIGTGGDIVERNDIWEYMDDNVSGTAYSSAANVDSNNSVTDGAWTLYNHQVYNSNSGNVGVGTSTPANKFSVVGNADFDGNVGIGTSSPNAQLHTTGKVKFEDLSGVGLRPVFADQSGNLQAIKEIVNSSNNNAQSFSYGCPGTTSTILLSGLPNSIPTNAISVTLNISHNQIGGLSIYLQAPNGDILLLASGNGGSGGTGFTNTIFSDASSNQLPYNNTGTPFSGTYYPTGGSTSLCGVTPNINSFSAIGGGNINANGNWVLKIFDFSGIVGYTLNNWSIKINNMEGGTDNYLPKWNNHTLTAKSLIFDNGTSVGIGTTAPGNMLTIEGTANNPSLSSNGILKINSGYNSINFGSMTSSPFSSWIQSSNAGTIALPLALQVAGGNVGIGVSNPVSKLNLVGAGSNPSIPGSSSTGIFRIGVSTTEGIDFGKMSASPFSGWIQSGFSGSTPDPLVLQPLGGNVGINTTTPAASLDFGSSGANRKIALFTDSNNDHQFYGFGINAASMRYQIGSTGAAHIFYAGNNSSSSNELMRIQGNGRVGIGTTNPNASLSVMRGTGNDGTAAFFGTTNTSHFNYSTNEDTYIRGGKAGSKVIINDTGGKVGIGTSNPDAALHITGPGGILDYWSAPHYDVFIDPSNPAFSSGGVAWNVQVHAQGWIWADNGGFVTTSDSRIKKILSKSNTYEDLQRLNQIEITNYKYIDVIANGNRDQKKVIAQQLQSVYPDAINTRKGIIPSVFKIARKVMVSNNTTLIETTEPHDFKTGDVVKLISEKGEEKTIEVIVIDKQTFSVAEAMSDKVFVYGKEVNDLLSVDYDAISMLNVSATQELSKQIEQLKIENESLKKGQLQLQMENTRVVNTLTILQTQFNDLQTKLNTLVFNSTMSIK